MVLSMNGDSLLSPYRVLDLTDEKGFLCGRILADLGADVIKIEKVGGDAARNIGPFYNNMPDPQKSLYWFCYNLNKRGITLNLESADGRDIFRKLVKSADFVIESFPPGYMHKLGLGYEHLEQINHRIILTSITPFGQTGPHKDYKASDIVGMAMGGIMFLTGDPDRPPVRISFPQAYLHASAEAAVASLIAHYHRQKTGTGQWVDVSMQESIICTTMNAIPLWEVDKRVEKRVGPRRAGLTADPQLQIWPCKDGYVSFAIWGGAGGPKSNRALVEWMKEEGMSNDHLNSIDWDNWFIGNETRESWEAKEAPILRFFMTKTKSELYAQAIRRGIMLMPVSTPADLFCNQQLAHRDFWVEVHHPELNATLLYPGTFCRITGVDFGKVRRRAPLIGEHNLEIYHGELGYSIQQLETLKQCGAI